MAFLTELLWVTVGPFYVFTGLVAYSYFRLDSSAGFDQQPVWTGLPLWARCLTGGDLFLRASTAMVFQ